MTTRRRVYGNRPSQLDELPFGSVIIDAKGESWTKDDEGIWYWCWYDFGHYSHEVPLPATLIWNPDEERDGD